jgi:hypothetical protein
LRRGRPDTAARPTTASEPLPALPELPGWLWRRTSRCARIGAGIALLVATGGGVLGHPYRALVDFDTGRYAFCKISGRPDPTPDPAVTTPRACGG